MRLIDADLLEPDADYDDGEYWAVSMGQIQRAPAIEERMKGKWKRAYLDHEAMGKRPSVLYCSICNQCIAYSTNFCPNCGARMTEEKC